MTDAIQVLTTVGDRAAADRIAAQLVERRLCACVQVLGPLSSTYRWQGAVERSQEWLCVAKTLAHRYDELEAALRELHPYEVPEILAVPIVAGHREYLAWLRGAVAP